MSMKIVGSVKLGDSVELFTLKGDIIQGVVTMKNDEDEILGIRKNDSNGESRYSYALIAGCEIIASIDPSIEHLPEQSSIQNSSIPTDFTEVIQIVREQGVSSLSGWNKVENKFRFTADNGLFAKKHGRIGPILNDLASIQNDFRNPEQYERIVSFFKMLETAAESALSGIGGKSRSSAVEKDMTITKTLATLTEKESSIEKSHIITNAIDRRPDIIAIKTLESPKPTHHPLNPVKSDKPSQDMFGIIIKATPDNYDKTRCYSWTIRADSGELYKFNDRNVADEELLAALRDKFTKNQAIDEYVQFQLLYITGRYGEQLCFANNIRHKGSNEGATSYLGVKYKKALEQFNNGKECDAEILPIFIEYFAACPIKNVAQNICTLYIRSGKPLKAVEFVDAEKAKNCLTDEEQLNIKYQAYKKMDEPEKAFEVEEQIIAKTINSANKAHHTLLAIQYLYSQYEFERALHYCKQWLLSESKKSSVRSVSEAKRRSKICLSAAKCIVQLRVTNGAYEPGNELLKEINADEQASLVLTAKADEVADGGISVASFDWSDIDAFTEERLNGLNLLDARRIKVMLPIVNSETGLFKGETGKTINNSARYMATNFTSNKDKPPNARYEDNIYAARVIYDTLNTIRENGETDYGLEDLLFRHLAKAMLEKANYLLHVDLDSTADVARFYYTESIKYTAWDGDQDRQDAVARCILSVFTNRGSIPAATTRDDHNLFIGKIADYLNNTEPTKLNIQLMLGVIARVIASLPPYLQGKIPETLTDTFYQSKFSATITNELYVAVEGALPDNVSRDDFAVAINKFWGQYREWERAFRRFMERVAARVSFARDWIEDTRNELDSSDVLNAFFKYMDADDRINCCDFMRKLLDAAEKFYNAEYFDYREECLKNITTWIDERKRRIIDTPTKYSYECLLNVLQNWRNVSTQALNELYANSPPDLKCEIVGGGQVHADNDGIVALSLCISNKKDQQTADNIDIRIEDKENVYEVLTVNGGSSRVIKGGGQKYCDTRFRMKQDIKAFDIYVTISYTYKGEDGTEKSDEWTNGLPLFCGESREVDFENPYHKHSGGEPLDVKDRSMMFGRDGLIEDIINKLQDGHAMPIRRKAFLLFGQKRAGKTTVLLHLEDNIRTRIPNAVVVHFGDIGTLMPSGTRFEELFFQTFFRKLSDEIEQNHKPLWEALQDAGIVVPDKDQIRDAADGRYEMGSFFDRFNYFISSSETFAHKTVVMMIDEFTYLYGWLKRGKVDDSFMKYWKAMFNEYGLVTIAVAQDYIGDFLEAYPNQFGTVEQKPVDYLSINDVRDMIKKPLLEIAEWDVFPEGAGDAAIQHIMEMTAGNAFFTMIFLDRLVDYLNDVKQPFVTPVIVDNVLKETILGGNNPLPKERFESLYNDDSDINDPIRPAHNLALLWAIAIYQDERRAGCAKDDIKVSERVKVAGDMTKSRIGFLVDKLATRGVLIRENSKGEKDREEYRIRVGMFKEWLVANCGADIINALTASAEAAFTVQPIAIEKKV